MKRTVTSPLFSIIPFILLLTAGIFLTGRFGNDRKLPDQWMAERVNTPKGPGYLPSDWMDRQRSFPHGGIKTEAYLEALEKVRQLNAAAGRSALEWSFTGPTNIGGRITDIEIPGESFTNVYVATASGGILKTTNNGASWVNIFKDQPSIPVGDIAIDRSNTNLMYAGTGEANSSSQSFRGDGIYKSTDGGTTWTHAGLELSAYIGRIVIDHSNPERVFVAACGNLFTPDEHRGVYRTTDGGNSWERVLFVNDSTSAIDIVQHPTNPDILYAAMWERMRGLNYRRSFGPGSGIWKSTDGGDTWAELSSGLPQGDETGRIGLAIAESSPSTLYAFYDNQFEVAVYKTQNSGQSWTRTNDGNLQGMNSTFGWYFGQIRVHPDDPQKLFVMGVYLYTSDNGGNTWYETGYEMHVDHHAMTFHPVTNRIYEGNDGGLYFSDNNGSGWLYMNNLPITQFYDIEIDRLNPSRIYGGTQDNNTIRTWTGQTGNWEAILGGDGFYSIVDYTNSNIIYAEYQWGALHKSTNGGSWMTGIYDAWSSDRVNWSAPVIMHPANPQVLYFGTYRVWRTSNGGNSWSAVSGDLTQGDDGSTFHTISTLAVSSLEPDILLAGSDDGRVHLSVNGGSAWSDISEGLPERWVTRVATDPFDVNTIYVTLSGFRWDEPLAHVYKSTDLGQHWQAISDGLPGLPVNAFVADPGTRNRFFIGTDAGIFMSQNGGESWEIISQEIGNVPVTSLKIHAEENFLVAGTYGLSSYKLDLNQLNVGVSERIIPSSGLRAVLVYPSPFVAESDEFVSFRIAAGSETLAQVRITGISGSVVYQHANIRLDSGMNDYRWNGRDLRGNRLTPGVYFLEVNDGRESSVIRFLML